MQSSNAQPLLPRGSDRLRFTTVASKSIRDRRLTGTRIPASKKETAIWLFADNPCATEVAKTVGMSLDSARGIPDREHEQIMKLRETLMREYDRLWKRDIEVYYHGEAERQYQRLWDEILKKQKALNYRPRLQILPELTVPRQLPSFNLLVERNHTAYG